MLLIEIEADFLLWRERCYPSLGKLTYWREKWGGCKVTGQRDGKRGEQREMR